MSNQFAITKELIDHCASRLVSYDTKANGEESVWPDDYDWADVAAARKDAEKVLRAARAKLIEDEVETLEANTKWCNTRTIEMRLPGEVKEVEMNIDFGDSQ